MTGWADGNPGLLTSTLSALLWGLRIDLGERWQHGGQGLLTQPWTHHQPHHRHPCPCSVTSHLSFGHCPQEEMTSALATMRVDYEQIKIKKIEDASNPLLLKRRKKARALEAAALAH